MKRSCLPLVTLAVMFVLGVLTVTPASAVVFLLVPWLLNGVLLVKPENVEAEFELLLEDTKAILGAPADVLCAGIFLGTVSPKSLGTFTEVLNVILEPISKTPLMGLALECTNVANCPTPLVWAVNLSWNTEFESVVVAGNPWALLLLPHAGGGNVGWVIQCVGIVGEPEDECLGGESVAQLTLVKPNLLMAFSEAFRELTGVAALNCSLGGVGAGLVVSDEPFGLFQPIGGGELSGGEPE